MGDGDRDGSPKAGEEAEAPRGAGEPARPDRETGREAGTDPESSAPAGVSGRMRRALASGLRTVLSAEEALREGFPKEVLSYAMRQTDQARDEVVRVAGEQIRRFLDNLDLAGEVRKILTSVSFEVRTQVRFVPNEGSVLPRVERTSVEVRRGGADDEAAPSEGAAARPVSERRGRRLTRAVEEAALAFSRELFGEGNPAGPSDRSEDGSTSGSAAGAEPAEAVAVEGEGRPSEGGGGD